MFQNESFCLNTWASAWASHCFWTLMLRWRIPVSRTQDHTQWGWNLLLPFHYTCSLHIGVTSNHTVSAKRKNSKRTANDGLIICLNLEVKISQILTCCHNKCIVLMIKLSLKIRRRSSYGKLYSSCQQNLLGWLRGSLIDLLAWSV